MDTSTEASFRLRCFELAAALAKSPEEAFTIAERLWAFISGQPKQ